MYLLSLPCGSSLEVCGWGLFAAPVRPSPDSTLWVIDRLLFSVGESRERDCELSGEQ
jgi:hypothetical protein